MKAITILYHGQEAASTDLQMLVNALYNAGIISRDCVHTTEAFTMTDAEVSKIVTENSLCRENTEPNKETTSAIARKHAATVLLKTFPELVRKTVDLPTALDMKDRIKHVIKEQAKAGDRTIEIAVRILAEASQMECHEHGIYKVGHIILKSVNRENE